MLRVLEMMERLPQALLGKMVIYRHHYKIAAGSDDGAIASIAKNFEELIE